MKDLVTIKADYEIDGWCGECGMTHRDLVLEPGNGYWKVCCKCGDSMETDLLVSGTVRP